MSEQVSLKKAASYFFIFTALIFGVFYVKGNFLGNNLTNNAVLNEVQPSESGDVQIINLGFKGFNYDPEIIRVKYNVPVRIVVDTNTVRGCMTNINIPAFGISKTVTKNNNIIEFIPTKKGTFKFSCPMGMGTGNIIVE